MKIVLSKKAKQLGNALLVAIVTCGILTVSIMGYLSLTEQQTFLSARSQAWNMAIAVTEAGVEDALQQLNSNQSSLATGPWNYNGSSYWRSNTLPDGNSYVVNIYMTNALNPTIISRAYTQTPTFVKNYSSSSVMFAAAGVNVATGPVTRAVKVTCSKGNMFLAPLVAKHGIDLKGNGVFTDSYDSSTPAKSTGGRYDSAKYSGDKGDIATNGGVDDTVGVQNANIYGKVHTGPGGAVSIGSSGGVGPHGSQVGSVSAAVAAGYVLQDANFTFPDTTLPNTTGYLTPSSGNIVLTSYSYNSNSTTSDTYPGTPWGGLSTNTGSATVSAYPNPVPPGLTTNTVPVTVGTRPSPAPAGMVTNTSPQHTLSYPLAGTYIGGVSTNIVSAGPPAGRGTWYDYNWISGYTYPTYTYSYPTYTYTYNLYTTNTIYTTNFYDNILYANNNYTVSSLSGKTIIMGPNVTLVLPNGMSGSEQLTFQVAANLLIYAGGTSVAISGNNYINPNGYAGSLIVYCAPSVTSFTLNGNGQFTGVIVAPNANVSMNGGGSSNEDLCGALMCNSINMNGHFRFHYDEALLSGATNGRYLVASWNEIP